MAVTVYDPRISVVLKKNIGRSSVGGGIAASQRYSGSTRTIDLTPFLGDRASVITEKSVRNIEGMFSITFADRMANGDPINQFESIYGLVEPMDVIEIRFAHNAAKYASGGYTNGLPIIMRGIVSKVTRNQRMGDTGPDRTVTISGQDYGKIFRVCQIAYLPNEVTGQDTLTYFKFFANYGDGSNPNKTATQFVTDIVNNVINKFIADIRSNASAGGSQTPQSPILDIKVDATVKNGVVAPFGTLQTFQGNVGEILTHFGDVGPWNEMFIEDRESASGGGSDAPYLVYRPSPFKDISGNVIQADGGAVATATVDVDRDAIFSLSSNRSDEGIYNYYWVEPSVLNMLSPGLLALKAAFVDQDNTLYLKDYQNSSPHLYGFRRLQVDTNQGFRADGQPEQVNDQRTGDLVDFAVARRKILVSNNRDNVVFEDGEIEMRGDESVKCGTTLRIPVGDGKTLAEHYAVTVRHTFLPLRTFTTHVDYERGENFIKRIQSGSDAAPYLVEMKVGGIY